jgi:hypothetical protein
MEFRLESGLIEGIIEEKWARTGGKILLDP